MILYVFIGISLYHYHRYYINCKIYTIRCCCYIIMDIHSDVLCHSCLEGSSPLGGCWTPQYVTETRCVVPLCPTIPPVLLVSSINCDTKNESSCDSRLNISLPALMEQAFRNSIVLVQCNPQWWLLFCLYLQQSGEHLHLGRVSFSSTRTFHHLPSPSGEASCRIACCTA